MTALAFSGSLCRSLDTICLVTALAFSGSLCRSLDTLCRVVVLPFTSAEMYTHFDKCFLLLCVHLAANAWKHAAWNQQTRLLILALLVSRFLLWCPLTRFATDFLTLATFILAALSLCRILLLIKCSLLIVSTVGAN